MNDALYALELMVLQYLDGSEDRRSFTHIFMMAGEHATKVLSSHLPMFWREETWGLTWIGPDPVPDKRWDPNLWGLPPYSDALDVCVWVAWHHFPTGTWAIYAVTGDGSVELITWAISRESADSIVALHNHNLEERT